ncbi:hypothetical protein [Streptomyces sp. NPDC101234]|uniref:hypothetical protein n=1 Tax=Streptomyces sp. NPDC101234 TaxID=3366138 RepID=UPI0038276A69
MAAETLTEFDRAYLESFTEPDAELRRAKIEKLWSADGRMVSNDLTVQGVDNIATHVAHIHEQYLVGHGLTFAYDQHSEAGEALLLRWSMLTPDGNTAARGVDVVFRDTNGQITTVYAFMGIN